MVVFLICAIWQEDCIWCSMNALPFIKDNLEAMAHVKNPAAFWLAHQRPDEQAVMEKLTRNSRGQMDFTLPSGQTMFETPPQIFYHGWADTSEKAAAGASIIVGCNLGYGLNYVLVNTPNTHRVLVVEPDPEMLLACLGNSDYSPFIRAGRLVFLPPDAKMIRETIQQMNMHFLFGAIHLRVDTPSRQLGTQYAQWSRICQEALENFSVELTTLRLRQDEMVGHEIKNFRRAITDGTIRNMRGTAHGLTAVILGAGPSLGHYGPVLAKNRGHALYATALQTLTPLQSIGLKPHFAMAIDYSEGMLKVYDRLDPEWCKDVPLLYSTKMHPDVVNNYPGPTIPFWTMGGMGTYAMRDNEHLIDAGGNVSVAIYRFLHWCGVERILLCGQDFAWKDQTTHAAGHHDHVRKEKHYKKLKLIELKNAAGETIHSTLSYITALRDLEKDIASNNLPTYNLYGGLAVIKGAQNVDENDLLREGLNTSRPGSLENFTMAMRNAQTSRSIPDIEPRWPKWMSSMRNARKHLEKLFKKPQVRQKEIRESIQRFHGYLRHDPLYLPYLYNELTDLAGMLHGGRTLGLKDFSTFKKIMERVKTKVREMDSCLATADKSDVSDKKAA